jgi:hypothetical protein
MSSNVSRPLLAKLAVAGCLVTAVVAMGACGSRTGLFGEDGVGLLPEGGLPDGRFIDAPADGPIKCVPGRFTFELATAQLMFVIDRSGSMAFALDGRRPDDQGNLPPGVISRWDTLRDALFQTITPFDTTLAMGAKFYPEELPDPGPAPAEEACRTDVGVGIPPARGNASSIINFFDTTSPLGGTPTSEAVRLAAQYLAGSRTVARTIILATDGAPNCNPNLNGSTCVCTSLTGNCTGGNGAGAYNCLDDVNTINVVRDVFDTQKIPVYVVGIGSTERPEFLKVLDDMAVAGGRPRPTTPRHYNVQTSAELKTALQSIGDSIAKCTYLTPSSPIDPNAISVEIGGKQILRDQTHTNGWDWIDQAFGTLAFFGPACTAASGGTPEIITGVVSCKNP